MRVILQVFYTLFSSLLLSLAIPNEFLYFGSPFIAFIALIPYYLAFKKCRSFYEALGLGFLQTGATHLMSSYWLAYFKDFAALTLGASAVGTACIGAFFGLFLYLPLSRKSVRNPLNKNSALQVNRPVFQVFWFAAVYTAYEWFKSSGFLGYPWGTISSCMFRARIFMQLSAITGTYGITFLTVFFSALIAEGITLTTTLKTNPNHKAVSYVFINCAKCWVVLFGLTMIYGVCQYAVKRTPEKKLTSILVQQNEDPWLSGSDKHTILLSEELAQEKLDLLKEEEKQVDLIVLSEGALKSPYPDAKEHYKDFPVANPFVPFIKKAGVPLLTGGSYIQRYTDGDIEYYNAALMFDKHGDFRGYYGKNHLVPFAEAIPFMEYPAVKDIMEKLIGISAGWTPGKQYTLFEIPGQWYERPVPVTSRTINLLQNYSEQKIEENQPPVVRISTPICFDDSFTDIMRPLWKNGTEVFMNITDDSWSLKKSSEIQHFVIASYRAIEYRTTLVRSTNAGLTCVLDPAGKVLCELPLFESCAASVDIPVYRRKTTTYARFGNWLPFILIILILVYWMAELFWFKKKDLEIPLCTLSADDIIVTAPKKRTVRRTKTITKPETTAEKSKKSEEKPVSTKKRTSKNEEKDKTSVKKPEKTSVSTKKRTSKTEEKIKAPAKKPVKTEKKASSEKTAKAEKTVKSEKTEKKVSTVKAETKKAEKTSSSKKTVSKTAAKTVKEKTKNSKKKSDK